MARLAFAALGVSLLGSSGALSIPPGYSKVLFEDDFNLLPEGAKPLASKWSTSLGRGYPGGPANWGTNEVQWYTEHNMAITDRALRITPSRDQLGTWTSSRIESLPRYDFACPPGGKLRIEASIRFGKDPGESQMGIWPSFWSMGSAFRGNYTQWPAAGEIDIAESINGVEKLYVALHCGWAPDGPCDEYTGLKSTVPMTRGVYHSFAAEIDRTNPGGNYRGEALRWYMNGQLVKSLDGQWFDEWVWTAVTRSPKFLLLNVAVGGDFADNAENPIRVKTPTAATKGGIGAAMDVKYVGVYST